MVAPLRRTKRGEGEAGCPSGADGQRPVGPRLPQPAERPRAGRMGAELSLDLPCPAFHAMLTFPGPTLNGESVLFDLAGRAGSVCTS